MKRDPMEEAVNRFADSVEARVASDDAAHDSEKLTPKIANVEKMTKVILSPNPAGGRSETDLNGTVANIPCDKVIDGRPHFPVFNEQQAASAVSRAMRIATVPDWFAGTVEELREVVKAGVSKVFPRLQVNVSVPFDKALSRDVEVKNPATVNEKKVPQVMTPDLAKTGNKNETKYFVDTMAAIASDDEARQALAKNVVENLEKQKENLETAITIANRLMTGGLTGEEFESLFSYLQEDIVRELMYNGATASTEDRNDITASILARAEKKKAAKKKKDQPYS